jgi:hypothetical protein
MCLNDKHIYLVVYAIAFIEGNNFYFFFLLCPCTTEHWLAYQWWYAYHSLRNLSLEDHGEIGLAGYSTTDPGTKCLRPTYPKANIITVFVDVLSSIRVEF